MNPLEEFLAEKSAESFLGKHGPAFGNAFAQGAGAGVAAAALTGIAVGTSKIIDAATSKRDYRSMLAWHPDLQAHDQPQNVMQAFRTMRRFAPDMTKDPLVAGSFVRQMLASDFAGTSGMIPTMMSAQKNIITPVQDAFVSGASGGVSQGIKDFKPFDAGWVAKSEHEKLRAEHDAAKQRASIESATQRDEVAGIKRKMQRQESVDRLRSMLDQLRNEQGRVGRQASDENTGVSEDAVETGMSRHLKRYGKKNKP
jgi:hypothetical protein